MKYCLETPIKNCQECYSNSYASQAYLHSYSNILNVFNQSINSTTLHVYDIQATLGETLPKNLQLKAIRIILMIAYTLNEDPLRLNDVESFKHTFAELYQLGFDFSQIFYLTT